MLVPVTGLPRWKVVWVGHPLLLGEGRAVRSPHPIRGTGHSPSLEDKVQQVVEGRGELCVSFLTYADPAEARSLCPLTPSPS